MKPPLSLRSPAWSLLLLLFALALPNPASSQSLTRGSPVLAPEARARLSQAAGDPQLAAWQRDFMLGLARGDKASVLDPAAAGAHAGLPQRAADAADGSWVGVSFINEFIGVRSGHSAIYDPVRDRMVVFGGSYGSYRNDVWALSLAGTPDWTELAPIETPPSARDYHTAIYEIGRAHV